jgi:pantoate kinase
LTRNLLEELKNLLLNPKIELFINKCYEFNELRNKTVHRLITVKSVKSTLYQCKKVKNLYNEIFKLFDKVFSEILKSMQNKEYYNDIEKALGIDSKKIEKLLMEVKLKINT